MQLSRNHLVTLLFVLNLIASSGCGKGPSWIRGKWYTELMGVQMEFDFKRNGDLVTSVVGGTQLNGRPVETGLTRTGKWEVKGDVLKATSPDEGTKEGLIKRVDDGFYFSPAGTPINLKFSRKRG